MQFNGKNCDTHAQRDDEYITIIAPSVREAMRQFKERGLDVLGYAIVGKVVRQQFSLVGGEGTSDMFEGAPMVSATWRRKDQDNRAAL